VNVSIKWKYTVNNQRMNTERLETMEIRRLNRRGDKRGLHPNSLKNLKPWKPGQSGNPKGRPVRYNPWDDSRFIGWLLRQAGGISFD
jgi:hypothetical protein